MIRYFRVLSHVGFFYALNSEETKMKTDAQLKSAIQDELRWEPTISSGDIDVATKDGIVTLSGTVPHYAEKMGSRKGCTTRRRGDGHR